MTSPDVPPLSPSPSPEDRLTTRILRVLSPARGAIGAARLVVPVLTLPGINARRLGPEGRKVVRVLGARQIAQAALTGRTPTRAVLWLGTEVDAAHAASMFGLAVCSRRYRRAALGDAIVAGTLAAAGAWTALHAPADPAAGRTPTGVWRDRIAERLARLAVPGYPPGSKRRSRQPGDGTMIGPDPAGGR